MKKIVTATEANRRFSEILADVRAGNSYTVTSHGRAVATIAATRIESDAEEAKRRTAWERLKARLDAQPTMNLPRATRAAMHER